MEKSWIALLLATAAALWKEEQNAAKEISTFFQSFTMLGFEFDNFW